MKPTRVFQYLPGTVGAMLGVMILELWSGTVEQFDKPGHVKSRFHLKISLASQMKIKDARLQQNHFGSAIVMP